MKKIFKMMFAVVAGVAALTACTNEPEEGVTPDNTQEYCIVKVGMSEATKGSLTDAEGIKWAVGDQISYTGGGDYKSEALTAEDIEDDGYTANFKFSSELNAVDRTGWFTTSTRNLTEFDFELNKPDGNIYSQPEAGVMNYDYIFLHSGTSLINITTGVTPEVKMFVAGGIFRFMPYTETYNNEVVKSVELKSNNDKHLVGTVAYDRGAGTYKGANEVNWLHPKPLVKVTLDEPFALTNANSRESSKGIYMAIARTTETNPIEGYTITVKTDVATYTFSSDENLVVGDNELRNVYLKLENGARVDDTAYKGDLQYVGDLNAATAKLSSDGVTDKDGGYWYAQTKDAGSDTWVNKDGNANIDFYSTVKFECIDTATGLKANWLSVEYGGNGGSHWMITATANTATEERAAIVTATYPDVVNGYHIVEECKTKSVTITQSAAGAAKVISFEGGANNSIHNLQNRSYSDYSLGYMLANIDGTANREWSKYYTRVEFKCISKEDYDNGIYDNELDWITCDYATNANGMFDCLWWAQIEANISSESRSAVIISTWPEMEGFVYKDDIRQHVAFINQEGGYVEPDPDAPITEGYTYNVEPAGPRWGEGWGFPANTIHEGNYAFIRNITKNGETIYLDGANAVANPGKVAAELVAMAFVSSAPTDEEKAAFGMQGKTASATAITARARWYGGVQIDVAFTTTDANSITKVTGYDDDGTELGYWIIWTD